MNHPLTIRLSLESIAEWMLGIVIVAATVFLESGHERDKIQ